MQDLEGPFVGGGAPTLLRVRPPLDMITLLFPLEVQQLVRP